MIISLLISLTVICIYLLCFEVQIVSHRRDIMHFLAWKIILVKTYQSGLSLQQLFEADSVWNVFFKELDENV